MQETILQIQGEITKVSTMGHRSLRLHVDTQENRTDEEMAKVMAMTGKLGFFTFSVEEIKPEQLLSLPETTQVAGEKTQSQRLRASLYKLWEVSGQKIDAESFYRIEMEKIISGVQGRIGNDY